jgi:hypothetical protein
MLRDASQHASAVEAPALASCCDAPQHEGDGARRILAKTNPSGIWPNEAKRGACARAKDQPAAVRNDRRRNFICFRIVIYNEVCNPHVPAGLSTQDFAKQHARGRAAAAAITFELVVHLSRAALRCRVDRSMLVRLLLCQTNRGGRIQRCSSCDSRGRSIRAHGFL